MLPERPIGIIYIIETKLEPWLTFAAIESLKRKGGKINRRTVAAQLKEWCYSGGLLDRGAQFTSALDPNAEDG